MTREYRQDNYRNQTTSHRTSATRTAALRREQVRRQRFLLIMITFTIIVTSVFFLGTIKAKASSKAVYKYYTTVEVQDGDTLWDLAKKYTVNSDLTVNEYIKEVERLNNIPHGNIKAGEMLTVIYYSSECK